MVGLAVRAATAVAMTIAVGVTMVIVVMFLGMFVLGESARGRNGKSGTNQQEKREAFHMKAQTRLLLPYSSAFRKFR